MPHSKLSLHVQAHQSWLEGETSIARWIKIIDPPAGANRWPGKTVVGRVFMPDHESNVLVARGAAGADEWFLYCLPFFARAPYVTYWEAPNEPQPVDSLAFCRALSNFTSRLADLMHAQGLRLIGGCLAEGNPGGNESERRQRFQAIAPGLAACDLWEQHCYWVPDGYDHPEAGMNQWHAWRHLLNMEYAAQAGIILPEPYIGECGIDMTIVGRPHQGWLSLGMSHAAYMEQLAQFDEGVGPVTSAAIFTAGPVSPWHDFEVDPQLNDLINTHIRNKETPMTTLRVYDKNGTLRDLAWLKAKYGNLDVIPGAGSPVFRLVEIRETEGPTMLKVRLLNERGMPHAEQPVALWWDKQDPPPLPDLTESHSKTLPKTRGAWQRTDASGYTGFGLGGGSFIKDPAEGGPHWLWVISPSTYSDTFARFGWLNFTNHMGPMELTYQIVDGSTPTPPPTPDPTPTPTPGVDLSRLARLHQLALGQVSGNRTPKTVVERAVAITDLVDEAAATEE